MKMVCTKIGPWKNRRGEHSSRRPAKGEIVTVIAERPLPGGKRGATMYLLAEYRGTGPGGVDVGFNSKHFRPIRDDKAEKADADFIKRLKGSSAPKEKEMA